MRGINPKRPKNHVTGNLKSQKRAKRTIGEGTLKGRKTPRNKSAGIEKRSMDSSQREKTQKEEGGG